MKDVKSEVHTLKSQMHLEKEQNRTHVENLETKIAELKVREGVLEVNVLTLLGENTNMKEALKDKSGCVAVAAEGIAEEEKPRGSGGQVISNPVPTDDMFYRWCTSSSGKRMNLVQMRLAEYNALKTGQKAEGDQQDEQLAARYQHLVKTVKNVQELFE
ncbi:hypothetical protein HDU98_008229 [Podochytrium sp. JEL0797]|nr:hypothetical protein HDU98_008229 [Podochytrium sp. JEL0797]